MSERGRAGGSGRRMRGLRNDLWDALLTRLNRPLEYVFQPFQSLNLQPCRIETEAWVHETLERLSGGWVRGGKRSCRGEGGRGGAAGQRVSREEM